MQASELDEMLAFAARLHDLDILFAIRISKEL